MKDEKVHEKLGRERIINNILLVVILFLLVYILFYTGIVKISSNNKSTHLNNSNSSEGESKEKLDVTDGLVTDLYKSVDLGRSYNALRHYYFYSYDSVYAKYMDVAFIKEMAVSKLTVDDTTTSINRKILENGFTDIVGNNAIYTNKTFQTLCATYKYNSTLDTYDINKNTACDTTNPDNYEYFDKITSAYKYSDRIEINTRVGYAEEEKQLVSEGVFEATGKIIVKNDIDSSDKVGIYTENLDQIKKIIDYKELSKYRYTFKLDGNKYYFYSVERIYEN